MTPTPNPPCTLTAPHPLAGTPCTFVEERPGTGTAVYMVRIEEGELAGVTLPVFPQVVSFQEEPCTDDPTPTPGPS